MSHDPLEKNSKHEVLSFEMHSKRNNLVSQALYFTNENVNQIHIVSSAIFYPRRVQKTDTKYRFDIQTYV